MWKGPGKILGVLALIGAFIGINAGTVNASVHNEKQTNSKAPLYLEHGALQNGNSSTILADHESHYSHSSHASHASHQSGY